MTKQEKHINTTLDWERLTEQEQIKKKCRMPNGFKNKLKLKWFCFEKIL